MAFVSLTDLVYPVGSVYISFVKPTSTSDPNHPSVKFGGTWTADDCAGKFLRGVASSANLTDGGADTVTLTINQMPSHSHKVSKIVTPDAGSTMLQNGQFYSLTQTSNYSTTSTGGGEAHNNIPAYKGVYIWRRTA